MPTTMIGAQVNRLRHATIVRRRSGHGFRLTLCSITRHGTPFVETLADQFGTVEQAYASAEEAGMDRKNVRCAAEFATRFDT